MLTFGPGDIKSPLPLTDPRDAVPHAHRAVHRYGRSVWYASDRWPSPVYTLTVNLSWQHLRGSTCSCKIF